MSSPLTTIRHVFAILRFAWSARGVEDASVREVLERLSTIRIHVPPISPARAQLLTARLFALAARFRLVRNSCLTRSLVLGSILARSTPGSQVTVVIGFRALKNSANHGADGHAWVTVDGTPFESSPTEPIYLTDCIAVQRLTVSPS